jgi:glutamate 5-kinase
MLTKCSIAHKLSQVGIKVHIANGKTPGILSALLNNEEVGTVFAVRTNQSKLKRWVANSEGYAKGRIYINEGAREKLFQSTKATSLLPIGICKMEGDFAKGDIVKILSERGEVLGLGKAQYNSETARTYIGEKNKKPLVHYDYLFLYNQAENHV